MDRRNFVAGAPLVAAGATVASASVEDAAQGRHFAVMKAVIMGWRQGDRQAVVARLADDIVWHSHVGSPPIIGKEATARFMETLAGQMKDVRWRIFSYAEHGDTALAEGVDEFTSPEGRQIALPYAVQGWPDHGMARLLRPWAVRSAQGGRGTAAAYRRADGPDAAFLGSICLGSTCLC